jgi:hypothetical protein
MGLAAASCKWGKGMNAQTGRDTLQNPSKEGSGYARENEFLGAQNNLTMTRASHHSMIHLTILS